MPSYSSNFPQLACCAGITANNLSPEPLTDPSFKSGQTLFVKIGMHFVQGVNKDPLKLQLLKSIQQIAASAGTSVIAEGIESAEELMSARGIGITLGQGYFLAHPSPVPPLFAPPQVKEYNSEPQQYESWLESLLRQTPEAVVSHAKLPKPVMNPDQAWVDDPNK